MISDTNFDLDFEQARILLCSVTDGCHLRQISRPASGFTDSVFVLHTDRQDFILRTFRETAARWKPQKEQVVYALLRQQGVPVPNIVKTDLSKSLLPFAFVLSEHLPGVTLSQGYDAMSGDQRLHVYRQLGDFLGRIHALTFSAFGDVAEQKGAVTASPAYELNDGPFSDWRAMHRQIVRCHLTFLQRTEFGDLVEPLDTWFQENDALIAGAITPRLLHMDLHCSNIMVFDGNITGILDVEESLIGHNEFDLMRTELAHFRDSEQGIQNAFFAAYTQHVSLDEGYERRKPFYELSRSLVGLRCFVQYGSRNASDLETERHAVRTRISELMESQSDGQDVRQPIAG